MPGCLPTPPGTKPTGACRSTGSTAPGSPTTTRTSTTAVWADEANPRDGLGQPYPLDRPRPLDRHRPRRHGAVRRRRVPGPGPGHRRRRGLSVRAPVGAGPLNGRRRLREHRRAPPVRVVARHGRRREPPAGRQHACTVWTTETQARAAIPARPCGPSSSAPGPNSSGYGIGRHPGCRLESDNGEFLGPVALYTTDANGKPDLTDGLHATLSLERTDGVIWYLSSPRGDDPQAHDDLRPGVPGGFG